MECGYGVGDVDGLFLMNFIDKDGTTKVYILVHP